MRLFILAALFAAGGLMLACDRTQTDVPRNARPDGFDQIVTWNSCGASGEYCERVRVFGSNEVSLDAAFDRIENTYAEKGWQVDRRASGISGHLGLILRGEGRDDCIVLWEFDLESHIGLSAPSKDEMAELVRPYETVIEASAGCG